MLGSPSDEYGGRALGLAVPEFLATVRLTESAGISIESGPEDVAAWASATEMIEHVDRYGLNTGQQLLAAAVRTFADVSHTLEQAPPDGFTLSYETTIPRQVGLAGSSALVISALRCLGDYSGLDVPDHLLASIALRAETELLGVTAGLQGRVAQCLGGLVSMDFGSIEVDARFGIGFGRYESIDRSLLPPMFVAYREAAAEPSGSYHRDLRSRFDNGDSLVRTAMRSLAGLVTVGRAALQWQDHERFGVLLTENMDLRRSLGSIPPRQIELVDLATSLEAPSAFAGSGGAVVGVFRDRDHLTRLQAAFRLIGAVVAEIGAAKP